ncbi:MAG: hypothetical protein AAGF46_08665 [Pseudomonadota bacterium]
MTWLTPEVVALIGTAATIGLLHTVIGPDHYLPFAAISRARGWGVTRTLAITLACGVVHIIGSLLLGLVGVALGLGLDQLVTVELWRGDAAAWLLLAFGLAYAVWGWRKAHTGQTHSHWHTHADGVAHDHAHDHAGEHGHVHAESGEFRWMPWALFLVFAFGPCEALIPLLMYPAAEHNYAALLSVCAAFALATLVTMLVLVIATRWGLAKVRFGGHASMLAARHVNTFAGGLIALCAVAMLVGL